MRLRPLLACLALLAAGCLQAPPAPAPPAFERADAPPVVLHAQNQCGLCGGWGRFENPEWTLFAVFADGRALRAHYNPGEGDEGAKLAPGARYDRAQLDALLRPLAEPARGTFWVARVETGAVDASALARLWAAANESWRPPSPSLAPRSCMDCTGHGAWLRPAGEGFDVLRPDLDPPEGTPAQQDFQRVMDAFAAVESTFRAADEPGGATPGPSAPAEPLPARS